jgi:imidazolonepropionase-like amidohydrolase
MKHHSLSKTLMSISCILFLVIPFPSCNQVVNHEYLITNVNIVDVKSGKILKNKTVAIDNKRISAIYSNKVISSDSTKRVDGSGKYLMPGLWDMHAHYKWSHVDLDPLLIANGITGIREMWGDMPGVVDIPSKNQIEIIPSPDIYTSGDLIDGNPPSFPGFSGCIVVTTPDEAVAAVDKQAEKKVDFVKVYSSLSEECFMAVSKEARKSNIPFAGHIPNKVSIYKAIDAGMASSEHLYGFLNACSSETNNGIPPVDKSDEELISTFSEARFDSLCYVLAKSNMWLCPTLTVIRSLGYLNDTAFTQDIRMKYLPPYLISIWNQKLGGFTADEMNTFVKGAKAKYLFELDLIGKMNKKGVKLLAGTDFPNPYVFPGFSLHDELALMVRGGMPALDALKSATLNAAVFMNNENDFGSVEVGKIASLVLLNKNPLENIENTSSIETVILRGRVMDKSALDKMLQTPSPTEIAGSN